MEPEVFSLTFQLWSWNSNKSHETGGSRVHDILGATLDGIGCCLSS